MAVMTYRAMKHRVATSRNGFDGHPALRQKWARSAAKLAHSFKCVITATTDGRHAPGSYHYQRRALDAARRATWFGRRKMRLLQRAYLIWFGRSRIKELFGPAGWYVKHGVKYQGHFPDHGDHVHLAI